MTTTERPADRATAIDESVWAETCALLSAATTAVLACHVTPDGDALGSMLGLAQALRSRGVAVVCTWGDVTWQLPPSMTWLPAAELCVSPNTIAEPVELLVVLDTGARDRLGVLDRLAESAGDVIVIDHHAHGSDIAAVRCVDPKAAATAVVVEELLQRLGFPLTEDIATCLYVGVVTDTGGFAHSVTTPAVHGVAARLLAAGAKPDEITRRIWGSRPLGVVHLLAAALARVEYDAAAANHAGLVWTWTASEDVTDWGLAIEDADAVMETIRVTREADVALVAKQAPDGSFKVSTRSRGRSDVGSACAAMGGGGHSLAAGFTAWGEPEQIVEQFLAALDKTSHHHSH